MAIVFKESGLATSEIFNTTLNSKDSGVTPILQQVKEYIMDPATKQLTEEDLEASFITLRHTVEPLTQKALEAFNKGDIILLHNTGDKSKSIVKALPFISLKRQGRFNTYVFMDSYINNGRMGLTTSTSDLRDLLVGALIANSIHINDNRLINNETLKSMLMEVYSKLFINILNRQYSLMSNKAMIECIQYWVNKFFLINIFNSKDSEETIDALASKHYKYTTDLQHMDYKRQYDEANVKNITDLLNLIKTLSTRMEGEDTYRFLTAWNNYYNPTAMLAIDDVEYLIFLTLSSFAGNSNLFSIGTSTFINDIKNIKNIRSELVKIV